MVDRLSFLAVVFYSPEIWWREGPASNSSVEVHWLQSIIPANGTIFKSSQSEHDVAAEKFCDGQWEADLGPQNTVLHWCRNRMDVFSFCNRTYRTTLYLSNPAPDWVLTMIKFHPSEIFQSYEGCLKKSYFLLNYSSYFLRASIIFLWQDQIWPNISRLLFTVLTKFLLNPDLHKLGFSHNLLLNHNVTPLILKLCEI